MAGGLDLEKALRDLGDNKAIRRALTTALLTAAEPAAVDARNRARAHRKTGETDEGIDVSTTLSRRQRKGRKTEGPASAMVYLGAKPRSAAVLGEFGTVARHTKTGKSTGSMPAHPFMRPAWEAHKQQILTDFSRLLWVTIEAEAKRLARKQAALIRKAKA